LNLTLLSELEFTMKNVARLILICSLSLAACSSAAGTRSGSRDADRITLEQLAKVSADNAYDAVRALQPQWLDTRAQESMSSSNPISATVFLNGARAGDPEFLRTIQINSVQEMRFIPANQASARYGMGIGRGVIEVTTKGHHP
jgi:hypothetical protein